MDLMKFVFEDTKPIRTVNIDGQIWFVGRDIALAMEYANPNDAIKRHCKPRGIAKHDTLINGIIQQVTIINESNLYRLVARSKKPIAELIEAWIFETVVPQAVRNLKPQVALPPQKPVLHPASLVLSNAREWDKTFPDEWYMIFAIMRGWTWKIGQNKPQCMAYYTGYYVYDRISRLLLSYLRKINPAYVNFHHQHLKEIGLSELFEIIHGQILLAKTANYNWNQWNMLVDATWKRNGHTMAIPFPLSEFSKIQLKIHH